MCRLPLPLAGGEVDSNFIPRVEVALTRPRYARRPRIKSGASSLPQAGEVTLNQRGHLRRDGGAQKAKVRARLKTCQAGSAGVVSC